METPEEKISNKLNRLTFKEMVVGAAVFILSFAVVGALCGIFVGCYKLVVNLF